MLILLLIFAFTLSFCVAESNGEEASNLTLVKASGHLKKQHRFDIDRFFVVIQTSNIDIYVEYSHLPSIQVVAYEPFFPYIKTDVTGKVLTVSTTPNVTLSCVPRNCPLKIIVRTRMVVRVENRGFGDIFFKDTHYPDYFVARTVDTGSIFAKIRPNLLQVQIDGPGDVVLEGTAHKALYRVNSTGSIYGFNMRVDYINVEVSDWGNAMVWGVKDLEAVMTAGGSVIYRGDPQIDRQYFGTGMIKKYAY